MLSDGFSLEELTQKLHFASKEVAREATDLIRRQCQYQAPITILIGSDSGSTLR